MVVVIVFKGLEKAVKVFRSVVGFKKEKENSLFKSKKERSEGVGICLEKDFGVF